MILIATGSLRATNRKWLNDQRWLTLTFPIPTLIFYMFCSWWTIFSSISSHIFLRIKFYWQFSGGKPTLPAGLPSHYYRGFNGCIRKVKIFRKKLDLLRHQVITKKTRGFPPLSPLPQPQYEIFMLLLFLVLTANFCRNFHLVELLFNHSFISMRTNTFECLKKLLIN